MGRKPCNCQPGAPCAPDCTPATLTPGGVHSDFVTAPVLSSGGVGNTLDPRAPFTRLIPGGGATPGDLGGWGSAPNWVGFLRPTQALDRQYTRIDTQPEAVGFHLHRVYADPDTGTAVSLMGEPVDGGHLYPPGDDLPNCGFEFMAGRPK